MERSVERRGWRESERQARPLPFWVGQPVNKMKCRFFFQFWGITGRGVPVETSHKIVLPASLSSICCNCRAVGAA